VKGKLLGSPQKYGLPPTTLNFQEEPMHQVVKNLQIPQNPKTFRLLADVNELKPDLVLYHEKDNSVTVVEVTAIPPRTQPGRLARKMEKLRIDTEKLAKIGAYFVGTEHFSECRTRLAYIADDGSLHIGPPPEELIQ